MVVLRRRPKDSGPQRTDHPMGPCEVANGSVMLVTRIDSGGAVARSAPSFVLSARNSTFFNVFHLNDMYETRKSLTLIVCKMSLFNMSKFQLFCLDNGNMH